MRAKIISFTDHGMVLAQKLLEGLQRYGIDCEAWVKKKARSRQGASRC